MDDPFELVKTGKPSVWDYPEHQTLTVADLAVRSTMMKAAREVQQNRKRFVEKSHLVWTAAINERIATDEIFSKFVMKCIQRHFNADWGDVCEEDKKANDYALTHNERVLSSYLFNGAEKVWIITEWDRSATTVLFPEDY
jgi:hypothetical protein